MSTEVKIPQASRDSQPGSRGRGKCPRTWTTTPPRKGIEPCCGKLPFFAEEVATRPSRNQSFGGMRKRRRGGKKTARERIAKLIGANTKEIVSLRLATEERNLAIKGVGAVYRLERRQPHFHRGHRAQSRARYLQAAGEVWLPRTYMRLQKDGAN